jgi:hypothetical protein
LLSLVKQILSERPTEEQFPQGKGLILVEDGAAGDPASLGTHCLAAMRYLQLQQNGSPEQAQEGAEKIDQEDLELLKSLKKAVGDEMQFLLEHAPKASELGSYVCPH